MRYSPHRWSLVAIILLVGSAYAYWDYLKYAFGTLIVIVAIKFVVRIANSARGLSQNLRLRGVDTMDGIGFEYYVAQLLIEKRYINVTLTEQYDYGVDILAEKDGIRWGVQIKRYSGLVKAAAVRQVVAGLSLYDCDRGMVITNSTFSEVAKHLAESNNCVLIDRAGLNVLTR